MSTKPIICVDLDGTITGDPAFYRGELRGLMSHGYTVRILTGNPVPAPTLQEFDMHQGREYNQIVTVPRKRIATFKVAYMKQVGARHLIDNRFKTIKKVQKAGFVGHWRADPEPGGKS